MEDFSNFAISFKNTPTLSEWTECPQLAHDTNELDTHDDCTSCSTRCDGDAGTSGRRNDYDDDINGPDDLFR